MQDQNSEHPWEPHSHPAMGRGEKKLKMKIIKRQEPGCSRRRQQSNPEGRLSQGKRKAVCRGGSPSFVCKVFPEQWLLLLLSQALCWGMEEALLLHTHTLTHRRSGARTHTSLALQKEAQELSKEEEEEALPPPTRSRGCSDRMKEGGICHAQAQQNKRESQTQKEVNPREGKGMQSSQPAPWEGKGMHCRQGWGGKEGIPALSKGSIAFPVPRNGQIP